MNLRLAEERSGAAVAIPEALLGDAPGFGGRIVGEMRVGTLILREGRVAGLAPLTAPPGAETPVHLLLPRLTEAHVHLDKCQSIDRCRAGGGDLRAAVRAQRADKALWTAADLSDRMGRGLRELIAAGCGAIRTHIDWPGPGEAPTPPMAWGVLRDLSAEAAGQGVTLQGAALTGVNDMADGAAAERVARLMAQDGGALGAFVFDQPDRETGLRRLFALADRFGLALDFHVDEGLDPSLDGLELIVRIAREMRHEGPVLCGHGCSLASRSASDVARIADGLAETGIAVAALPATNLYLQGRGPGTPDRRGLTRLHELAARGVPVIVGTDNVRDAFCPVGRHDPLHSLSLAVLAAHLDPPLERFLPMIADTARAALGLPAGGIPGARPQDLLIAPVASATELLAARPSLRPLTDLMTGESAHGR